MIVKLDTEEWDDELSTLEDKVTAAERKLTATERQLTAKQRGLVQADINLRNAQINLEQTDTSYTTYDIKAAQADVDTAERDLQDVIWKLSKYEVGTLGYEGYQKLLVQAQVRLNTAEDRYDAMLSGYDTEEIAVKKLTVELNEFLLVEAQNAIEDAQTAIEDARKELLKAQKELDEANSLSPEVRATFDGFVTKVNVEGGDEVFTGTIAMHIADPNKFEAEAMVSEMDILQIKLGGEAQVQVDAVKGLSPPAKVTRISPTATIQSGVVNYIVKVEVQSLQTIPQEYQEERQGQQGQTPAIPPEDYRLREGLTVTVSILVDERNDVLLVPNMVITTRGMEAFVQVIKDGITEERSIRKGISNWQYTEVIAGLSEGEKVVLTMEPSPDSTSSTPRGRMPIFGPPPH